MGGHASFSESGKISLLRVEFVILVMSGRIAAEAFLRSVVRIGSSSHDMRKET